MKNIKRTSDLVKAILKEEPKARDSFPYLYYMVCLAKNPKALGMPFAQVIMNLNSLNLPPFESVRRSRQRLQAAYPELAGSDEVVAQKAVNEAIVRDYARAVDV